MYNMMASAASPREQREQRGSSPRGQASNAAASRNRVKLYGCNVSWRFKKAQYRQKNRMKWRAKTRTRRFIEGFTRSVRYFFGIHTFSQRAFYPFLPCQTRISVFYVHTSFVAALNRIYWHSRFRSCFNKTIYIFLYPRYINISLKDRFLNVKINIKVDR